MNPKNLKSLAINGIDCYGLNEQDRKEIEKIGYWRWLDKEGVLQAERLQIRRGHNMPVITDAKLADEAREKQIDPAKRGPKISSYSKRGNDRKMIDRKKPKKTKRLVKGTDRYGIKIDDPLKPRKTKRKPKKETAKLDLLANQKKG